MITFLHLLDCTVFFWVALHPHNFFHHRLNPGTLDMGSDAVVMRDHIAEEGEEGE